jgi:signal transduction histidine kinase
MIWPALAQRVGGERWLLGAFVACYLPIVWLGYQLKTGPLQLSLMWPAVGLLLAALFVAPLRRWPVIILLQLICEYSVGLLVQEASLPFGILLFMLANSANGVVAALIARARRWSLDTLRGTQILLLMLGAVVGAASSGTVGAAIAVYSYGAENYAFQWQVWLVSNALGALVMAPVAIFWATPGKRRFQALILPNRWELPVLSLLLALSTWWLFDVPQSRADSLLRSPTVPLALLVFAAFRVPPRWASAMALGMVLLALFLSATHGNPFTGNTPYSQILALQAYLAVLAGVTLVVSILVAAMRIACGQALDNEGRYRHFIALSSEAVWRVEIDPPLPVALDPATQRKWLHDNARVAESNAVFDRLAEACTEPGATPGPQWSDRHSWCALFEGNLEKAASAGYQLDDLRLAVQVNGQTRNFIVTYSGVVTEGKLQRLWCVARDITELSDVTARLLRERERLRAYAQQVVNAEERARRATAQDLHDGIGQTLTGMAMSLEVARMQSPQAASLLDDVRANLRAVQDRTRNMIAELSPPGLYDLGLGPALQWLVVHFRSQEKLRVELECRIAEDAIPMELRVLIFKLVRELLRNVVKHAGVSEARVVVRGDRQHIDVEVEDTGRGFEWQLEMFGPRPGSFGLWSITDRVADMGGEFSVDAAPGHGSRFRLKFPLTR